MSYIIRNIVLNKVETYDSLVSIGFPSDEYEFYDFGRVLTIDGPMNFFYPNTYYN